MSIDNRREQARLATWSAWGLFIEIGDLKVGVGAQQEFDVLLLFSVELGIPLHGDDKLELPSCHPLEFPFETFRISTVGHEEIRVLHTVQQLDCLGVVHETRDGTVQSLSSERSPNTGTEGVLGSRALETDGVEWNVVSPDGSRLLIRASSEGAGTGAAAMVGCAGFLCENLGILDEVGPLERVKLLKVLQKRNTGGLVFLANDLPEREQDLLGIVGSEDREGGHPFDGDRLRHLHAEGLGEEGNTTLGLAVSWEEVALQTTIILGGEEEWSTKDALTALGGDLLVEQLLDVIDGQKMFAVHGDDDGVPDLRDEDLKEISTALAPNFEDHVDASLPLACT